MKEAITKRACKAHCLVLPFPLQGHINPLLQFSKRLQHGGVKVTLVTTLFLSKIIHNKSSPVALETISDGYDEGGIESAETTKAYVERFWHVGLVTLTELVEKINSSSCPIDCIIYDSVLPWALDVAKKFGLVGAVFFTQPCAVNNIYYHVQKGLLKLPLTEPQVLLPGLPTLAASDMPSFISNFGSYPVIFGTVVDQFSNVEKADWVLCNTFYELEKEVVDWMGKMLPPLITVGPTVPSMYLDHQLKDDKDYGFHLFNPTATNACLNWLNQKPKGSVIYISFGSMATLKPEEIEEIAWGLVETNIHFLWVVRATEESKLPKFCTQLTSQKAMIVQWCPQLEVLSNDAIGCFVTHCGWNSTLEALSLGVPMVAMPQWTDQITNAKFIVDVWRIGLRVPVDFEKGIVRREDLGSCVREIMEGEIGVEIRRNAGKWRKSAVEAVEEGGTSSRNIQEFVAKLVQS